MKKVPEAFIDTGNQLAGIQAKSPQASETAAMPKLRERDHIPLVSGRAFFLQGF